MWEMAKAGFANDEAYYRVQGLNVDGSRNADYPVLLDLDNLIDLMLVTFYSGNLDGPITNFADNLYSNNWFGIRNRNGDQGFQFFVMTQNGRYLIRTKTVSVRGRLATPLTEAIRNGSTSS